MNLSLDDSDDSAFICSTTSWKRKGAKVEGNKTKQMKLCEPKTLNSLDLDLNFLSEKNSIERKCNGSSNDKPVESLLDYKFKSNSSNDTSQIVQRNITMNINNDESSKIENRKKENQFYNAQTAYSCPMCWKNLSTEMAQISHMKMCGKKQKMNAKQLLEVLELHKKKMKERIELQSSSLEHCHTSQIKKKKIPALRDSYDLALALALSKSLTDVKETGENKSFCTATSKLDFVTLEKFGFTSVNHPKEIGKKTSKKTEVRKLVLKSRTEEDRVKLIIEKAAVILLSEDYDGEIRMQETNNFLQEQESESFLKIKCEDSYLWQLAEIQNRNDWYVEGIKEFISEVTSPQKQDEDNEASVFPEDNTVEEQIKKLNLPMVSVAACWKKLINCPKWSDLTIISNDGRTVYLHSVVIYARCPAAFDFDVNLIFSLYHYDTILVFLQYLYCGLLDDLKGFQIENLLNLARSLGFEELVSILNLLKENLSDPVIGTHVSHDNRSSMSFSDNEDVFKVNKVDDDKIFNINQDDCSPVKTQFEKSHLMNDSGSDANGQSSPVKIQFEKSHLMNDSGSDANGQSSPVKTQFEKSNLMNDSGSDANGQSSPVKTQFEKSHLMNDSGSEANGQSSPVKTQFEKSNLMNDSGSDANGQSDQVKILGHGKLFKTISQSTEENKVNWAENRPDIIEICDSDDNEEETSSQPLKSFQPNTSSEPNRSLELEGEFKMQTGDDFSCKTNYEKDLFAELGDETDVARCETPCQSMSEDLLTKRKEHSDNPDDNDKLIDVITIEDQNSEDLCESNRVSPNIDFDVPYFDPYEHYLDDNPDLLSPVINEEAVQSQSLLLSDISPSKAITCTDKHSPHKQIFLEKSFPDDPSDVPNYFSTPKNKDSSLLSRIQRPSRESIRKRKSTRGVTSSKIIGLSKSKLLRSERKILARKKSKRFSEKSQKVVDILTESVIKELNNSIGFNAEVAKTPSPLNRDRSFVEVTPALPDEEFTDEVSPLPDFSKMGGTTIKKHLSRYGLKKSLSKSKAKKILRHIYEELHPILNTKNGKIVKFVPRDGKKNASEKRAKKKIGAKRGTMGSARSARPKKKCLDKAEVTIDGDNGGSCSGDPGFHCSREAESETEILSTVDSSDKAIDYDSTGSEFEMEEPLTQNPFSNGADARTAVYDFIQNNPEIRRQILMYEPIWVEKLRSDLFEKYHSKYKLTDLMDTLDALCISFRYEGMKRLNDKRNAGRK